MMDKQKKDENPIAAFIKANNRALPAGINFAEPIKRVAAKAKAAKRLVSVGNLQTDQLLLDDFYKAISRPVNMKLNEKK
jgi:hypothetical protein